MVKGGPKRQQDTAALWLSRKTSGSRFCQAGTVSVDICFPRPFFSKKARVNLSTEYIMLPVLEAKRNSPPHEKPSRQPLLTSLPNGRAASRPGLHAAEGARIPSGYC